MQLLLTYLLLYIIIQKSNYEILILKYILSLFGQVNLYIKTCRSILESCIFYYKSCNVTHTFKITIL